MSQKRWPTLAEVEEEHIMNTLQRCDWNIAHAAQALDISRSTLHRRLRGYRDLLKGTIIKPSVQLLAEARRG